ncbi:MAG TPA: hypothetical protein VF777_04950 [Phycisphaerales bacterium]
MNNKNPSLLEGLNLPESMTGKPAPARRDLGVSMPSFQPSDWTPTQKKFATGALAVAALAMLVGGAWLTRQWMPPSMPTSFADGASVIATGRINNLDEIRRGEYYRELARLWPSLSEEERNKWRSDPAYSKMMEQIREQQMDDFAKRVARGEEKLPEWGPPPGPRPEQRPEPKPDEQKKDAQDPNKKPQDRQPGAGNNRAGGRGSEQRRQMITNRITNSIMNRNPQSNGLRGEMMQNRGGGRGR